jgi:hypothetical protein
LDPPPYEDDVFGDPADPALLPMCVPEAVRSGREMECTRSGRDTDFERDGCALALWKLLGAVLPPGVAAVRAIGTGPAGTPSEDDELVDVERSEAERSCACPSERAGMARIGDGE